MPTFWKTDLHSIPKKEKVAKIPKPIRQISEKKKARIKEHGSESELFREIWNERNHACDICGHPLREARAHNFDHTKPKSGGEKYRLDKANIQILCFSCHFEKTTGLKYKGVDLDL